MGFGGVLAGMQLVRAYLAFQVDIVPITALLAIGFSAVITHRGCYSIDLRIRWTRYHTAPTTGRVISAVNPLVIPTTSAKG